MVEADFTDLPYIALKVLESVDFVLEIKRRSGGLTILVKSSAEAVPKIVGLVDANGGKLRTITLRELTLDDVFLDFTGRSLRE
ncbi:MAG: hypothetical protein ABSD49_05920 [Candidatus Bathyarchaeia archaeon]